MKPFAVEAIDYDKVPEGQVVFIPNHASFIDSFALTAALPEERLRDTQWAGWVGIAFGNPIFSYFSRLAQVIPIDAEKSMLTSLGARRRSAQKGHELSLVPRG